MKMPQQLMGASVWEEELYEHLVGHEKAERGMLEEYEQAAAEAGSPAFTYLVSLIVEDEIRHHRIFRQLASSLRADVELRPEQPEVPRLDRWGEQDSVLALTELLLAGEREDRKRLKRLSRDLRDVEDTTLWSLLVTLMEMDTDKHIEILEFVRRHADARKIV
jgi:hypothetical protein